MKKPRLVSIGDLMLDVVVRAETPTEAGTDVPGSVGFRLGGSAGNTCREWIRLGGTASLVCAVGDDRLGKRLVAAHRREGVKVHAVARTGLTPRLAALIAADGQRSFTTQRGVADSLPPTALKRSWFARASVLHIPAYSLIEAPVRDASSLASSWTHAAGGAVSVDLASHAPLLAAGAERIAAIGRDVRPDFVFGNVDEVNAAVAGGREKLLDLAPIVVIKLGGQGCRILWRDPLGVEAAFEIEVPTKHIATDDTTGAGDAFAAGFLHELFQASRSRPFSEILRDAANSGHRAAARVLTSRRQELDL